VNHVGDVVHVFDSTVLVQYLVEYQYQVPVPGACSGLALPGTRYCTSYLYLPVPGMWNKYFCSTSKTRAMYR
jgi:hypothetical protein